MRAMPIALAVLATLALLILRGVAVMAIPITDPNQTEIPLYFGYVWPNGSLALLTLSVLTLGAIGIGLRVVAVTFGTIATLLAAQMCWEDYAQLAQVRPWLGRHWEMMPGRVEYQEYSPMAYAQVDTGWIFVLAACAVLLAAALAAWRRA